MILIYQSYGVFRARRGFAKRTTMSKLRAIMDQRLHIKPRGERRSARRAAGSRPLPRSAACAFLLLFAGLAAGLPASEGTARAETLLPAPLSPLPPDRMIALAPMLRHTDLLLMEGNEKGVMRQITTVTFAQAPPATVHTVVKQAESYTEFVRNMSESKVTRNPDGTVDHDYRISYPVQTLTGRHRYAFLPPAAPGGVGPIDVIEPDGAGVRHYRWEFLPAEGGTLVVLYGYSSIPGDKLLVNLLNRASTLEYGLALIP